MATNLTYDEKTQKWVASSVTSSGGTTSTSSSSSSKPASSKGTQTDAAGTANKAQAVLEYNTLNGDLVLRTSEAVLGIQQGDTINIDGVGKYLSGLYFVDNITYTIDTSSGTTISATVIKTGFGSSLKSPTKTKTTRKEQVVFTESPAATIAKGSSVKIVGDSATYSNASAGVKVPAWVKAKTLTVAQISTDGTRALLQPINSWTYLKNLQKV